MIWNTLKQNGFEFKQSFNSMDNTFTTRILLHNEELFCTRTTDCRLEGVAREYAREVGFRLEWFDVTVQDKYIEVDKDMGTLLFATLRDSNNLDLIKFIAWLYASDIEILESDLSD